MTTGYRGNPEWRDMSDYVVHFTRDVDDGSAYDNQISILWSGSIRALNPYGSATNVTGLGSGQHCACFSEIPLDMLERLVGRRSQYGLGFHQQTILAAGGGRVWYLPAGTPSQTAFHDQVRKAMAGGVDPQDAIWRLTPLVDRVDERYAFEWEREWRIPGGLQFTPEDVAFLFIPEERHVAARYFLGDGNQGAGPAYRCPILDPLWDEHRLQDALADVGVASPPA